MTLDIIIPVYNEQANLQTLLPYLIDKVDLNNTSIYVVDAKDSTDRSKDICNRYRVNYLRSDETQRSKQLNDGAKRSYQSHLFFLHADVIPPSNFYRLIANKFSEGYKAGCFAYQFNSDKLFLKVNSFFTRFNGIFTGGGDQGLFISRQIFEQLGGFCERHRIMEDFEFYHKIKKNKIPFTVVKRKALVSPRKYENRSWLRVNLINLIALFRYKINQNPERVYSFYKNWLGD